ncbi:hypothetical protein IMX26_11330 [Clostridium sp. 'deep sea']|uniref:hypothetical protein n=1 Tax=Clostridium sp. 'deep sea' TaxID=2779445 RepID=UPI0018968753|nr:hypothetical protein [Clostridium sp. 'deep sea']QOR34083.1 hypothetical protein IMX26_11330 [Clostridium sp. 'deep sea']
MFQKKISSNIVNDKKKQYSDENITYSKRLQKPNKSRNRRNVIKLLQEWQSRQKNKPIEVEQKYYYTDEKIVVEKNNIISKKQEEIKLKGY